MSVAFVYIATNQLFPGIVKIGHTLDSRARLDALSAALPVDFELAAEFKLPTKRHAAHIERCVHMYLDQQRVRRELFRCTVSEARDAIGTVMQREHAWSWCEALVGKRERIFKWVPM